MGRWLCKAGGHSVQVVLNENSFCPKASGREWQVVCQGHSRQGPLYVPAHVGLYVHAVI